MSEAEVKHTEVEAEHVHALRDHLVHGGEVIPDELLAIYTGEVLLAELSARLIDTEPLQLLALSLLLRWGGEGGADQSGRRENVLEKHRESR